MILTMGEPLAVEPSFSFEGGELVALAEGGLLRRRAFRCSPTRLQTHSTGQTQLH